MKVEFHLGTHKTGTTTIQNRLFSHRAALLDRGVLYPLTGVSQTWHIGHRHTRFIYGTGRENLALTTALVEEIKASGAAKVVLSYEAWSNLRNLGRFNSLLRRLEQAGFADFHGTLMLRNRAQFIVSHYREFTINQKNRLPFEKYIEDHSILFDYAIAVQMLRSVLDDRLTLVHFDRHDDIYPAFCHAACLPEALDLPEIERGNVKSVDALDVEAVRIARTYDLNIAAVPDVLPEFRARKAAQAPAGWTERFAGDLVDPLPVELDRFAAISGWGRPDVADLFRIAPPVGSNVAEVRPQLCDFLLRKLA